MLQINYEQIYKGLNSSAACSTPLKAAFRNSTSTETFRLFTDVSLNDGKLEARCFMMMMNTQEYKHKIWGVC